MSTEHDAPDPAITIAFQGEAGANSDLACRTAFPGWVSLPCRSFEDAFAAVRDGRADHAMIAVDNSLAGRVADVHHLLPDGGLFIVGEHFQPIHHQLLALPGTKIEDVRTVHSHVHALGQCRRLIARMGVQAVVEADTAGAARRLSEERDPTEAVIATELAADMYGLETLAANVEDADHNTTRFLVMSRQRRDIPVNAGPCLTTFLFQVRSVPAALYKALGGFATNGINLTKLESYLIGGAFVAAQFIADAEGHPDERLFRLALEELQFFTERVSILGTYPADPFRQRTGLG